jgi:hypothetical protein
VTASVSQGGVDGPVVHDLRLYRSVEIGAPWVLNGKTTWPLLDGAARLLMTILAICIEETPGL